MHCQRTQFKFPRQYEQSLQSVVQFDALGDLSVDGQPADQQRYLYDQYLHHGGNLAARPGYSNHQGGTSADLSVPGGYGSSTYRWLSNNARRYGFVNDVSGEPWHWTFR